MGMSEEKTPTSKSTALNLVRRVSVGILTGVAVLASLLTFPEYVSWMFLAWVVVYCATVVRGGSGWLALLVIVAVLVAKMAKWCLPMIATVVIMFATTMLVVFASRSAVEVSGRRRTGLLILLVACLCGAVWTLFLAHQETTTDRTPTLDKTRPIVCIGDSVTSGIHPYGGYTDDLAEMLSVPVVNLGRPGVDADFVIDQLERIKELQPQAVVLEIGGHDFLKGATRDELKTKLEEIVDACLAMSAEVVLVEIPRGLLRDPYRSVERQIAAQRDLTLLPDSIIRQFVFWGPHAPPGIWLTDQRLSDDGIHPNNNGNRQLARVVADALVEVFGGEIRR